MAEFVSVGKLDIDDGEVQPFSVNDRQVAIANVGGTLYAFSDICTHRGCALSSGELDGTSIECECHGSVFDITSGEVMNGPASEPIETFEVLREGDDLQIGL